MQILSHAGSTAAVKLEELLLNKQLMKDMAKLSPKYQTSTLEAKHSLDIQFVPKHTAFSYWGMYTRCVLLFMFSLFPFLCASVPPSLPLFSIYLSLTLLKLFFHICSRLCLSALHYNENADRMQAVTVDGRPKYAIRFPKAKHGEHSVRTIKTEATYSKYTYKGLIYGKLVKSVRCLTVSLVIPSVNTK